MKPSYAWWGPRRQSTGEPNTQFVPFLPRSELIQTPHWSHFQKQRRDTVGENCWKANMSTSADFKQQSDGRDYLGSKKAALHTTQEKGPKELLVISFMFVFTGNPEHSFLFFYAKKSKHGPLCRLMKMNSSESNGRSFLSSVLELDVLVLLQVWHILFF